MNSPVLTIPYQMKSPQSKSPSPRRAQASPQKHRKTSPRPTSKMLSPAEAIAEAWKRESEESKARWMRIHANMQRKHSEPRSNRDRRNKL
ncbi:hypothetical protein L218DRAFT_964898 [Marasmius fiardii PR-910]|nr:hypothetical protein L218DRAFT_964898 [Marasmius fiardii PR-910]